MRQEAVGGTKATKGKLMAMDMRWYLPRNTKQYPNLIAWWKKYTSELGILVWWRQRCRGKQIRQKMQECRFWYLAVFAAKHYGDWHPEPVPMGDQVIFVDLPTREDRQIFRDKVKDFTATSCD